MKRPVGGVPRWQRQPENGDDRAQASNYGVSPSIPLEGAFCCLSCPARATAASLPPWAGIMGPTGPIPSPITGA